MKLLVLLVLTFVSCQNDGGKEDREVRPISVRTSTAKIKSVVVIDKIIGKVVASKQAKIFPQTSGIIFKRLFEQGTIVEKGDSLYRVEPKVYEAGLDASQAELDRSNAQLKTANSLLKRYKELRKSNAISQQKYIAAKNKVTELDSMVSLAKAKIEQAKVSLDDANIKAPIAGYIGKSNFMEGDQVTAGQTTPLTTIYDMEKVYVDVSIPWSQLKGHDLKDIDGRAVEIRVRKEKIGEGTVISVEPFVGERTGAIKARIMATNEDNLLVPGMYVETFIKEVSYKKKLVVPVEAVQIVSKGRAKVWTVKDSKAYPIDISLGKMTDKWWIVEGGLEKGQSVIVSNIMKIRRPETPVKIIGEEDPNDTDKNRSTARSNDL
jgi:membrane fusion protein (multidrug efflux system)